MKKRVLITGSTGHMGRAVFDKLIKTGEYDFTLLIRRSKKNLAFVKKYSKIALKKDCDLKIVFGNLYDYDAVLSAVEGADYVLHMAAIIPPKSDYDAELTYKTNFVGTKCLIDAIDELGLNDTVKFVNTGTVAEYGNRDYHHPWGRVGDPLVCSIYDVYGASKIKAERYVLDSKIEKWVSLRQTGMLYDELLDNRTDGLMFHTVWNCPIEWSTDITSAVLLSNLLKKDCDGTLPENFWKKCYNIGNGASSRVTGYDSVDTGFKLMGASVKDLYEPHDDITRNFHCMWFYDSDVLNDYLDFRCESFDEFFKRLGKKLWYFKLGKPFKKIIKKAVIQKCYNSPNAPVFWVNHNNTGRINAFYGGIDKFNEIPKEWKDVNLLRNGKLPDGSEIDYNELKDITKVKEKGLLLNHGYDETKSDDELCLDDMKQAAEFRGGVCLSESMIKGDLYTPLKWKDFEGNEFFASPYTVIKAGHWSKEEVPAPWRYDEIAKHSPFIAQIWYDTHDKNENNYCEIKDCGL